MTKKRAILLIAANERVYNVTPVINHVRKCYDKGEVIVVYGDKADKKPEGLLELFEGDVKVSDYMIVMMDENRNFDPVCMIERKSGDDFVNTDPKHISEQMARMNEFPKIRKFVIMTEPLNGFHSNPGLISAGITRQLSIKMRIKHGEDKMRDMESEEIDLINVFSEHGFALAIEKLLRYYIHGHVSVNKPDESNEMLVKLAGASKYKIDKPGDALFAFVGCISGVGAKTAKEISDVYGDLHTFMESAKNGGPDFLAAVTRSPAKSKKIYACISKGMHKRVQELPPSSSQGSASKKSKKDEEESSEDELESAFLDCVKAVISTGAVKQRSVASNSGGGGRGKWKGGSKMYFAQKRKDNIAKMDNKGDPKSESGQQTTINFQKTDTPSFY